MSDQSKLTSLVETNINVGLGFIVSLTAWPFVGALYNIPYTYSSHIGITLIFTVLAIMRGYLVRRFFANKMHEASAVLAKRLYEQFNN